MGGNILADGGDRLTSDAIVFLLCCRRVNVTHFGDKAQCFPPVEPQNNYIVFAEMRVNELIAKYDDLFGAAADWSQESEKRVWTGVGEFKNVSLCDVVFWRQLDEKSGTFDDSEIGGLLK
jgi:hypothetical protein